MKNVHMIVQAAALTVPKSRGAKNKDNYAGVKKVIAVVSGKGGVGKSMVTSLLAVNSAKTV